jgi:hypothetical protein
MPDERPLETGKQVIFMPRRIADGDWQIDVYCFPGADIYYVKGFTTEDDARKWMNGSDGKDWKRQHGFRRE